MPNLSGLTTNFFPTPNEGFTTTTSGPVDSSSDTVVPLNSVSGLTNGSIYTGLIDPGNAKERAFTGVVDTGGSQITSVVFTTGTNATHTTGATVVDYVTGTHIGQITKGIRQHANQDGSLIEQAVRDALNLGSVSTSGWEVEAELPDTITYNGNRSYTLVFNTTDLTDTLSEGMKLRLTRTVSAPTQCADLESGSSQYFNKTSPAGMTFTDDFVVSAWVKMESYADMNVVSRFNGTSGWRLNIASDGRVNLQCYNAGAANYSQVLSYQSIPFGKWVHIAAQIDMSAFTATTTTSYIMIDGIDVPATVARGGTNPTALVQAGDLQVGASNTTGYFDGKVAQVAIYNAKVTQATIRTSMSQTLSGSETSLISAYSLSNSINDLNTTNANNLTAQNSAVATNVDSPFGNYLGGTLEYGVVSSKPTFSTNTTVTVQVPEGCAIPTSGGISAVAYSTQGNPYLFPKRKEQWKLASILRTNSSTTSNATYGAFISGGYALTVPIGNWEVGHQHGALVNPTTTAVTFNISPTALTGLSVTAGFDASPLAAKITSPSAAESNNSAYLSDEYTLSTANTFVMYTLGATASASIQGSQAKSEIFAEFNLL